MDDWTQVLHAEAGSYARVALANIKREFPSGVYHTMKAPGDFPYRPRALTPAFYGSFDWHSSVEMHWLLVRLLRVAAGDVPADEIRVVLGAHFERVALAAEEEFITGPDGRRERPYGWGWALALIHETASWTISTAGSGRPPWRRWPTSSAACLSTGWRRRPTRSATECIPTARSGCPGRCRTRPRGPGRETPRCWTPSPPRPATGSARTCSIQGPGSRRDTTSCRRR